MHPVLAGSLQTMPMAWRIIEVEYATFSHARMPRLGEYYPGGPFGYRSI